MEKMLRIVVLVSGSGSNLQNLLDGIAEKTLTGVRIVGVISNNAGAYALERARKANIPALAISPKEFPSREMFYQRLEAALEDFQPDLMVLAGFLVVLPENLVKKYENRILNIHPSLIPAFCGSGNYGRKVHENAIARGVKLSGATVHFVDAGTDTGPILLQKSVPVFPDDTPEILQKRVQQDAEAVLLPQAVQLIADGRVFFRDGNAYVREVLEDETLGT